jgi:hypothetical protein
MTRADRHDDVRLASCRLGVLTVDRATLSTMRTSPIASSSFPAALAALVVLVGAPAVTSCGGAAAVVKADAAVVDDAASMAAKVKAAEGFVLTATSGEASRDASRTVSTWTVSGARIHVAVRYEGPDAGQPGREPQDADGDINDPAAVLAQAIGAEALLPPTTPAPELVDVTYRSFCIERAGGTRCSWQVGDAPATDAFRALLSLESRLTTYVVLAP